MSKAPKVCPVVYRGQDGDPQILAFRHPLAGNQFVKGTIEEAESPLAAAFRELGEESGLRPAAPFTRLGAASIGDPPLEWHFYAVRIEGLPESWEHHTEDDHGHVFSFFWQPLSRDLDDRWHSTFHCAWDEIRQFWRKMIIV